MHSYLNSLAGLPAPPTPQNPVAAFFQDRDPDRFKLCLTVFDTRRGQKEGQVTTRSAWTRRSCTARMARVPML